LWVTFESFAVKFLQENLVLIAAAFVSGLMLLWPLINRRAAGASLNHIGATRLINDHNATILDVRPNTEYAAGHVANSKNIPLEDIDKRLAEVSKDKPVIVVCAVGQKAGKAAALLRAGGMTQVFVLDGGLTAWREAGLPVVK
jgi:rhodanese-related sulfurtransferase